MTINTAKIPEIIKVYGRMFLILWDEEAWFWGGKIFNQNSSESNNKTSDNG
ncbi:hypothetical protein ACFLIN_02415 [Corynebacterium kutscheri]|uniref:hypothetical protein n=1 Tax=Corynebacterium kutscheri TaxID=35755 RepID=UPI00155950C1|nr:hypothetical protein [Corynebacterium kutscheri]